mmetsp:Transcript_14340/g.31385  ORF Transcript_14340/g.31385 Transcript_14340/m.31385 type:complete len:233 (-) Transcript_14340:200-898(-)
MLGYLWISPVFWSPSRVSYSLRSLACMLLVAATTGDPSRNVRSSSVQVKVGFTSFTAGSTPMYAAHSDLVFFSTKFSRIISSAMARYSFIPSGTISPPNTLRAAPMVMHIRMGIVSSSSPSLTRRRARRPRPVLSLVVSSTVSVDTARGWGAVAQSDSSERYTSPSSSSQDRRAAFALRLRTAGSFGSLERSKRPFIFISRSKLPRVKSSVNPPAFSSSLAHSESLYNREET